MGIIWAGEGVTGPVPEPAGGLAVPESRGSGPQRGRRVVPESGGSFAGPRVPTRQSTAYTGTAGSAAASGSGGGSGTVGSAGYTGHNWEVPWGAPNEQEACQRRPPSGQRSTVRTSAAHSSARAGWCHPGSSRVAPGGIFSLNFQSTDRLDEAQAIGSRRRPGAKLCFTIVSATPHAQRTTTYVYYARYGKARVSECADLHTHQ